MTRAPHAAKVSQASSLARQSVTRVQQRGSCAQADWVERDSFVASARTTTSRACSIISEMDPGSETGGYVRVLLLNRVYLEKRSFSSSGWR